MLLIVKITLNMFLNTFQLNLMINFLDIFKDKLNLINLIKLLEIALKMFSLFYYD